MKTRTGSKGNIEILLLLGCLVGVVAFFSLTLAVSNVMPKQPGPSQDMSQLKKERDSLIEKKQQKDALLDELKKKHEQLLKKRKELEEKIFQDIPSSPQEKEKLEQILKETQNQYTLLEKRIKKLKQELNELIDFPYPKKRTEKEKEVQELEKKLVNLKEKIDKISKKLAGFKDVYDKDSSRDEIEKIRTEFEEVKQKKDKIKKEIDQLKIKMLTAGTSQFKNPLYVDCKRDFYVIYPRGEKILVSQLKKRNIFKDLTVGHDIIVLYVRPEGFKSFREAYPKVQEISKQMSIARCYEPIEADQSLDMLKRTDQ